MLHRPPKLEKVYHKVSEKAYKFCQECHTKMKFRCLCEIRRNYLKSMQRRRPVREKLRFNELVK